jgi:hypothetical protein
METLLEKHTLISYTPDEIGIPRAKGKVLGYLSFLPVGQTT